MRCQPITFNIHSRKDRRPDSRLPSNVVPIVHLRRLPWIHRNDHHTQEDFIMWTDAEPAGAIRADLYANICFSWYNASQPW